MASMKLPVSFLVSFPLPLPVTYVMLRELVSHNYRWLFLISLTFEILEQLRDICQS